MSLKRQRNRGRRALLLCALCLLALLSVPLPARAAGEGAAVVVRAARPDYGLTAEQLVVDLYYVGSIAEGGCRAVAPFGSDLLSWKTGAEASELADAMAGIAFDRATPLVNGRSSATTIRQDDAGAPLPGGLYLVVVRGAGVQDYVQRVRVDGKRRYVTIAENASYQFRYLPALAVLRPEDGRLEMAPKADVIPLTPPGPWPTPTPTPTPTPPGPTPTPPPGPTPTPGPDDGIDIPDEGVPHGPLPQTGQLWWPVPLLAALGVLLVLAGAVLNRRRR